MEISAEAREWEGHKRGLIGEGESGSPRLPTPAPTLEQDLAAMAGGAPIVTGARARNFADEAEAEALETIFPLPGGGSVSLERTRALIAVDIDVGERPGQEFKRATRAANLAGLATAARVLRLKGEGGLVVVDLAGRGHDAPAMIAAARIAFAPDNPGVALGPVSRFGTRPLPGPRPRRSALTDLHGRRRPADRREPGAASNPPIRAGGGRRSRRPDDRSRRPRCRRRRRALS